jgi:hypothetical protein
MDQEMTKPFKTVTTEYFEELDMAWPTTGMVDDALRGVATVDRRIKVVTTTKQWFGSDKDPIVCTIFEYL